MLIEDLRVAKALFKKHGAAKNAAWFGRLIALAESDAQKFWLEFNCNEIWGGPGSICDQFLVPDGAEPAEVTNDRKQFYGAMSRLAGEMADAGIVNQRAQRYAEAFRQWGQDAPAPNQRQ